MLLPLWLTPTTRASLIFFKHIRKSSTASSSYWLAPMPRMSYLYILMASSFTFFRSLFKSSSQQTCLSTLFNFSNPYLLPTTFTQASSLINTNSADLFSSVQSLSCVWLFATPWTAARQASLSLTNSCSLFKLTLLHFSCAFFIFLMYSNTYFVDYLLSPLE